VAAAILMMGAAVALGANSPDLKAGSRHDAGPAAWLKARFEALFAPAAPPPLNAQPTAPALPHYAETDKPATDAPLSAQDAIRINAAIPFSREPVLAAAPFRGPAGADRGRAVDCLTAAVYYEAGFEPTEGQRAVAQVILNRVRHPAFPKTVCGVVFEGASAPGCQFTFACDGSTARTPSAAAWARAREVAIWALNGNVMTAVGEATHYHAQYVAPYWGRELVKIRQIGAHIFYRWQGAWGLPSAFGAHYGGVEPILGGQTVALNAPAAPSAADTLPPEPAAPDDVGGRVILGRGWVPSPPPPTSNALSQIMAAQSGAAAGPQAAPAT
jgi:spore germination cell wall hydrolase CwlJ-like protein